MIRAIRHTGLVVADLDRALHFWCDVLGFVVERQMDESGPHIDGMMGLHRVRLTTVKLAAPDGNLIELLHFHSHPDKPIWAGEPFSTGFTHIALTVENLDELLNTISDRSRGLQPNTVEGLSAVDIKLEFDIARISCSALHLLDA